MSILKNKGKIFWYSLALGLFLALSALFLPQAFSAQSGSTTKLGVTVKEVVRSWENDDHTKLFVETNSPNLKVELADKKTGLTTTMSVTGIAEIPLSPETSYQIVSGL